MSQIIKLNLTLILAIAACGGFIFTAVAAFTRRDQDVASLKEGFAEMKNGMAEMRSEFSKFKDSRGSDREALISIQRDLQWLVGSKKTAASNP